MGKINKQQVKYCNCVVLLILIFSHEHLHVVDARHHLKLKRKVVKYCLKCATTTTPPPPPNTAHTTVRDEKKDNGNNIQKTMNAQVEAFRPTAPGHSPGVGHSIQH
ncbi:hypothetical protein BVC80_9065g97 [Macleaya cordata]|uniref:Uncharacterized protein n=1 Tax=Macleaya cordata TaxID=56857 RepID=A0A200PNN6_MACCD|nr:hypothetical protein BVC80_9065g97 [Macleaya cordata]